MIIILITQFLHSRCRCDSIQLDLHTLNTSPPSEAMIRTICPKYEFKCFASPSTPSVDVIIASDSAVKPDTSAKRQTVSYSCRLGSSSLVVLGFVERCWRSIRSYKPWLTRGLDAIAISQGSIYSTGMKFEENAPQNPLAGLEVRT